MNTRFKKILISLLIFGLTIASSVPFDMPGISVHQVNADDPDPAADPTPDPEPTPVVAQLGVHLAFYGSVNGVSEKAPFTIDDEYYHGTATDDENGFRYIYNENEFGMGTFTSADSITLPGIIATPPAGYDSFAGWARTPMPSYETVYGAGETFDLDNIEIIELLESGTPDVEIPFYTVWNTPTPTPVDPVVPTPTPTPVPARVAILRRGNEFNSRIKSLVTPSTDYGTKDDQITYIVVVDTPFEGTVVSVSDGEYPVYARIVQNGVRTVIRESMTLPATQALEDGTKVTVQVPAVRITQWEYDEVDEQKVEERKITDGEVIEFGTEYVPLYTVELYSEAEQLQLNSYARYSFQKFTALRHIDLDHFYVRSSCDNISYLFMDCKSLREVDLTNFDTSGATEFSHMFENCSKLEVIDCSMFDTSNAKSLYAMFAGCSSASDILCEGFNTSKVTNMGNVFFGAGVTHLDLSGWDTSNVTTFTNLFRETKKWNLDPALGPAGLNISGWQTPKLTSLDSTFRICYAPVIDVSSFDTSNVTSMSCTFQQAKNVTELAVEGWNVSKVTSCYECFQQCGIRGHLDLRGWDVSSMTNLVMMFAQAYITSVDMEGWTLATNANVNNMFQYAQKLQSVNVSGWDTTRAASARGMFLGCNNAGFTTLDLSDWDTTNVTMKDIISNSALTTVYTPKKMSVINEPPIMPGASTSSSPWYMHIDQRYVDAGYDSPIVYYTMHFANLAFMSKIRDETSGYEAPPFGDDASEVAYYRMVQESLATNPGAFSNTSRMAPACLMTKGVGTIGHECIAAAKIGLYSLLFYKRAYMNYSYNDIAEFYDAIDDYVPIGIDAEEYHISDGRGIAMYINAMSQVQDTAYIENDATPPEYFHLDIWNLIDTYTEDDWAALSDALDPILASFFSKAQPISYSLNINDDISLVLDSEGLWSNKEQTLLCTVQSLDLIEDYDFLTISAGDLTTLYDTYDCMMSGDFDMGARVFLDEPLSTDNLIPSAYSTPVALQTHFTNATFTPNTRIYGKVIGFTNAGTEDGDYSFLILPATSSSGTFELSYVVDRPFRYIFPGLY